jgi:hypothetical protein
LLRSNEACVACLPTLQFTWKLSQHRGDPLLRRYLTPQCCYEHQSRCYVTLQARYLVVPRCNKVLPHRYVTQQSRFLTLQCCNATKQRDR